MSKQVDSDKAAALYAAALSEISSSIIHQALGYFSTIEPNQLVKNPDRYFENWFEMIDEARQNTWQLGQTYYRLDTAIWTGTTPDDGSGEVLSLKDLWKLFLKLIGLSKFKSSLPNSDIELTDPVWEAYDRNYSRRNAAATFYTRAVHRLKKFEDANRKDMDADEYLSRFEEVMKSVGNDMARESQRLTQNGGRDAVLQGAQNTQGRRIGYMRVPQGSYTCGFCIMLSSRGAVYPTKGSAGFQGVGREYHPGCDCAIRAFYEGQTEPKAVQDAKDAWKSYTRTHGSMKASDFVKWWKNRKGENG
ncbi:hypothetical protein ACFC1L_40050 [Streptomyces sp. NPDC056210]|uniref:VG15 protein n=1 Tax=Streptomyces sp. NPDC056210 TaxID=3345746 RepID=UPI0035D67B8B